MNIKFITSITVIFTLMVGTAFAQTAQNAPQSNRGAVAPAQGSASYIHRPDSTQYHPQKGMMKGKAAAPASGSASYIHRPDSTQYHPNSQKKNKR